MNIRFPMARLSPAKRELVVLEFSRSDIEANHLDRALSWLQLLVDDKAAAESWEGRVTFFFSGWDDDPRETAEIPALREWFGRLSHAFPYWFHVCEKGGDTIAHVFRLLCPGHIECVEEGLVGWRFDDLPKLSATMKVLFDHQNSLYQRLGLSEEMNQRVSEEVAQIMENSLV
jgi:hypothetical protein